MPVTTLSSSPSLGSLFATAALTGPLHRGGALPDSRYELPDQSIDQAHLAAYDRVCGFGLSDTLPATYLHVLAFPLSVKLMTERAFPFPLVGLVHVENTITVVRPVSASEPVSFAVRAADLRDHPAGTQVDLVAEARVEDELVWSGRSTYLRRGASATSDAGPKRRDPAPEQAGSVAQVRVPSDIGRRYGAVSGDRNPIHLHALTARAFGFPKAIAHGMWLKARVLAALQGRLPDAYSVHVSFKTPVLLPSTVALATEQTKDGWNLDVRNARSGKPHLAGSVGPVGAA